MIIAAEGDQKILLQTEFPQLEILPLPGYRLSYGRSKMKTIAKIIFQVPKILIAINREKAWLHKLIKSKHLDIVISDNRYGLRHKKIFSVFLTHQLAINSLMGRRVDGWLRKLNYRLIEHFDTCWVADNEQAPNLAGALSHPVILPAVNTRYIGILSRIKKTLSAEHRPLLILLSGPEPQRTLLENILLAQLKLYPQPATLVRGLQRTGHPIVSDSLLTVYNHLPAAPLQQLINESAVIISRPGYSTIMDLLPLGKRCIFIPTPGQGEQVYLAEYLTLSNWACQASQDEFDLATILKLVENVAPPVIPDNVEALRRAVQQITRSLNASDF